MASLLFILLLAVVADTAPRCDLKLLRDCADVSKTVSKASGVYTIYPSIKPAQVYCDMATDKGRWTVFQRRVDGSTNFYRGWSQYKAGFGSANGEYWLGLDNLHYLTNLRKHELRVDMEDFTGSKVFAFYSSFSVGPESNGYKLTVTGFKNGGAGNSLSHHNGFKFSTFDKDQDASSTNCAVSYYGAFWYNNCHQANPNGEYLWGKTIHFATSINWSSWKGYKYSLKAISMKIRPVS
ncbi:microfibril-associated glycoprotein 4-like [Hypomesus transpacificus]|uniref:microfibril-associated glycoprotein 4-like n=1 Tax=Hypomesus transpacificus TaxID=137520 RepID=UPI001F074A8A|nr:microfibril-associated glycoprotein 4-like [Hypomesus transpacificus]